MSWVIDKDEQFVRDVHYVFKGNLSEIGHRKQVLRTSSQATQFVTVSEMEVEVPKVG